MPFFEPWSTPTEFVAVQCSFGAQVLPLVMLVCKGVWSLTFERLNFDIYFEYLL